MPSEKQKVNPQSREHHYEIKGNPQSKANSRMIVKDKQGHVRSIKSPAALTYERSCIYQLKAQKGRRKPLNGSLAIEICIWYKTKRNDLDPSIILDCLQHAEIIENDRQFIEMHFYKNWDKEDPRATIDIWEMSV